MTETTGVTDDLLQPTDVATVLNPAARVLWRSNREAQLEMGARRVVVDGVGTEAMRCLVGRQRPTDHPAPGADLAPVRQRLLDAGFLWTAGHDASPAVAARQPSVPGSIRPSTAQSSLPPDGAPARPYFDEDRRRVPPRPRLAGELTALSARFGDRAAEVLAARGRCTVAVHGDGRVGPHVAAVLAAAGVGRVHVCDTSPTRLQHAVPGGTSPADEGLPLSVAATAAMRRGAPEVDCVPPAFGDTPDLVVLACDEPVDGERRDALHARGCAHLLVRLAGDHGSVGPLVIPGLTSCLRCADLHRLDRDPAWNALAVQLAVAHRASGAGEVALATVIAGLAAMQVLDFLDGGRPDTVDGTLELHRPDWRTRRRSWPLHPDCDCAAGQTGATQS